MRLSFATDTGDTYQVEVDPQMEMQDIMALLEAESGIPVAEQRISHNSVDLVDPKATLASAGVQEDAMLLLRRKAIIAGRTAEHDEEMMRLQLLGDPNIMRQLREASLSSSHLPFTSVTCLYLRIFEQTQPEMADAVQNNPQRFAELLRNHRDRQREAELAQQREISALNADPFNVEAQRRIEENIRQQAVLENMEHAMEYSPEFFGRVTMLYIPVEVNGTKVKAFVDSGAQQTIMSPECAEQCGLLRLLDTRFSGIAKGVGTAKILGRVHSAQMKLSDLHLACAFTIMEGRDVDLLFGLDMLKAHQACIDLEKGVLRIQGREVKFLAEHELPDKARLDTSADLEGSNANSNSGPSTTGATPNPSTQPTSSHTPATQFPGGGNTLGAPPTSAPGRTPARSPAPPQAQASFPEESIQALVGFGATREQAIQLLQAAGGNPDVAASLLFQ